MMKLNQVHANHGVRCSGGPRTEKAIRLAVGHVSEGGYNNAPGVAAYLKTREDGSAHKINDDNATIEIAPDNLITCHAGNCNAYSLGFELCGYSGGTLRVWLKKHRMTLDRGAYQMAHAMVRHRIPLRMLTVRRIKNGARSGWTWHKWASLGGIGTDHTDIPPGTIHHPTRSALAYHSWRLRHHYKALKDHWEAIDYV